MIITTSGYAKLTVDVYYNNYVICVAKWHSRCSESKVQVSVEKFRCRCTVQLTFFFADGIP